MPNTAKEPRPELNIAVTYLMTLGADWVENQKVREFICTNPIDGAWLHKFLDDKIDPLNPVSGITHRRLKPEVLDLIKHK